MVQAKTVRVGASKQSFPCFHCPSSQVGMHDSHRRRNTAAGKIQGDGRKFLDRFKSYSGSQISSRSLNEIHIYRLQAKSATKDDFFHIFLSLIVSSSRRMLPFDLVFSNNVNASLVPILARQLYSRLNVLRLHFFPRTFSVVFNCRSLINEAAYLAALRRLRSPFAIRDADSKQSKTKIYF